MRHYVPKKNNPHQLPHNIYMQVLYLIRDYEELSCRNRLKERGSTQRRREQQQAVCQTAASFREEYNRRQEKYGCLDPIRAFFDYPYFSCMFAEREADMGASKRQWNLYRCRFAHRVAKNLELVV